MDNPLTGFSWLRDRPLPASPPVELAQAPRPWLTRQAGECAFPVDGEGCAARACCNDCGSAVYCLAHRTAMRGPTAPSFDELVRDLAPWL